MKKKIFFFFLLFLFVAVFSYTVDTESKNSDGFYTYLNNNINNNITVTLLFTDSTITGTLLKIYDDGIVVLSPFKSEIFIMKNAISYIRINSKPKQQQETDKK